MIFFKEKTNKQKNTTQAQKMISKVMYYPTVPEGGAVTS